MDVIQLKAINTHRFPWGVTVTLPTSKPCPGAVPSGARMPEVCFLNPPPFLFRPATVPAPTQTDRSSPVSLTTHARPLSRHLHLPSVLPLENLRQHGASGYREPTPPVSPIRPGRSPAGLRADGPSARVHGPGVVGRPHPRKGSNGLSGAVRVRGMALGKARRRPVRPGFLGLNLQG